MKNRVWARQRVKYIIENNMIKATEEEISTCNINLKDEKTIAASQKGKEKADKQYQEDQMSKVEEFNRRKRNAEIPSPMIVDPEAIQGLEGQ